MKYSRYNITVRRGADRYLFNGVSGALVRLTEAEHDDVAEFVRGSDTVACSATLLEALVRGRMLVNDDCDELEMLRLRYESSRHGVDRLALTVGTSLGCNFDCPYCFEAKHPEVMQSDVQAALLRFVDSKLPTISSLHVQWFGGEPLIGRKPLLDLSDELIRRADDHGVDYGAAIVTNGYLLGKETCRLLKQRRVENVQITLDGPPDVHNSSRPLLSGAGTFDKILKNLHIAVDHFKVSVRVNLDKNNVDRVEELLAILQEEGLSGRIKVSPGQIVALDYGSAAPSVTYGSHRCFSNKEFAGAEQKFFELAAEHGFGRPALPGPKGTPCTAVRVNELVVGSRGELYKCYESVGNPREVIGNIHDVSATNSRLAKWLTHDPFSDDECRSCPALPVCMGGCAHRAMDDQQYSNRCDTFRHTYETQILDFVGSGRGRPLPIVSTSGPIRNY